MPKQNNIPFFVFYISAVIISACIATGCGNTKGPSPDTSKNEVDSMQAANVENAANSKMPLVKSKDGYKFMESRRCRGCHPDQAEQWKHSLHAKAHFEPVYDQYFIAASIDTNQEIETFCANCHTHIGVLNGEIPYATPPKKPGDTVVSKIAHEGLTCDFCHLVTGYKKTENFGFILNPSKTKYGAYKDSKSPFHKTEANPLYRQAEYCGTCHNVNHPTNGIVLESTYTEWKEGPYAKEGITCQNCHMTNGLTKKMVHPGKAAKNGPQRDHVSKHYFAGPNIMFSNTPETAELKKQSLDLLKRSGKIEIGKIEKLKEQITIPIMVTNTGAGHYLPTGVSEIRELWIELIVKDAKGQIVYVSGALDENDILDPKAMVFRTEVVDKNGQVTSQFWKAVKKVRDHRIAPKQTVTEKFSFVANSSKTAFPLTVDAALKYRSVSPAELAAVGAPANMVEIPVITISKTTAAFKK